MADTRILHKKGSHGERIVALDHLEFRVWVQYVLSSDDFGVMRASVSVLRADNPRLEQEPIKNVERALGRVLELGLIQRFKHQGQPYLWQIDWQDFQGVRYPRETVHPLPPPEDRVKATLKTQKLFAVRSEESRGDFCVISETTPIPAGAGARQTQTLTPTPSPVSGSSEESARETKPPEPDFPVFPDGVRPAGSIRATNGLIGNALWHQDKHAWCCDRGLCVPLGLHFEFIKRLDWPDADARLRVWYPAVVASYQGRPIGDDVWQFWRNEFAAWVGTVTSKPSSAPATRGAKNSQILDEVAESLEAKREERHTATEGRHQMALSRPPR